MPRIYPAAINRRIGSAIFVGFLLALPLFISTSKAQAQEVRTVTVDKSRPVKPGDKEKPTQPSTTQSSKESVGPEPLSHTPFCDLSLLLILDDVGKVRILAFNGPRNSTVNFTTAQTTSGVLGMSHSSTGPFVESIVVPVPLDGNGNGQSEIFYVEGLQLGDTVLYATSVEMGNTTLLDYMVLPQCNCPPIPVVP